MIYSIANYIIFILILNEGVFSSFIIFEQLIWTL